MDATFGFINFEDIRMTPDDKYTTAAVAACTADAPATKNDSGKPRMDLVAPEAILAMASVLEFGARKYAERNWEKGMAWGRIYAAVQRHLHAWAMREEIDPESGMPHLWHALCGLHFLVTYDIRGVGDDDRALVLPFADNDNDEKVEYDVVAVEQMDLICKDDPDLADDDDDDEAIGPTRRHQGRPETYDEYIRRRIAELNR